MKRPLALARAGVVLLSAVSALAVEPPAAPPASPRCPVLMLDPAGSAYVDLAESDPDCVAAGKMLPLFARLREKAGFAEADLGFILMKNPDVNASFDRKKPPSIRVNTGFLRGGPNADSALYVLAHEIGHAVQDRGPEGREYDALAAATAREKRVRDGREFFAVLDAWDAFTRRYEGQADGIAQQLLVEAGYPVETGRKGSERFFGCSKSMEGRDHPAPAQRLINASFGQELLAKHARAAAAAGAVAFDGGVLRGGGADGPVVQPAPPAFKPAVRLSDYDDKGALKVGRFVASRLSVPPPPPGAGSARVLVQAAAASVVDYWIVKPFEAAVNGLTRGSSATETVLAACGTPEAARISEDAGVLAWTGRLAREGARKAVGWLSP
ncbi:MAG: hypothetical protein PHS14_09940 [Elusimicrobia bacterium]|nr:hypothetical protein [Elusimicrobiota bacterium]